MVNKPLITPYFWKGYLRGGVGWLAMISATTFIVTRFGFWRMFEIILAFNMASLINLMYHVACIQIIQHIYCFDHMICPIHRMLRADTSIFYDGNLSFQHNIIWKKNTSLHRLTVPDSWSMTFLRGPYEKWEGCSGHDGMTISVC